MVVIACVVLWLMNILAPVCDFLRSPLPKYRLDVPPVEVAVPIEEIPAVPVTEVTEAEPVE